MKLRIPRALDSVELAMTGRRLPDPIDEGPEWIDPEGDDWYTELYRQIEHDGDRSTSSASPAPDLGLWFG